MLDQAVGHGLQGGVLDGAWGPGQAPLRHTGGAGGCGDELVGLNVVHGDTLEEEHNLAKVKLKR